MAFIINWSNWCPGPAGNDGAPGAQGPIGLSAYQVASNNGFVGAEDSWLSSLIGAPGSAGSTGAGTPRSSWSIR